jgi:hypothetical protein
VADGLNQWGWWDGIAYRENREKHTAVELRQYAGEWIGWDLEGTKVVAHHEDAQEVVRQVRAMGLDTDRVVMEWMPPADYPDDMF